MEEFEATRRAVRQTFMKMLANLDESLQAIPFTEDEVNLCYNLLHEKFHQLEDLDRNIFELMLNSKMSENKIAEEIEGVDEYKMKFLRAKLRVDKELTESIVSDKSHNQQLPVLNSQFRISNENDVGNRNFQLPKLEMKKFNGNVKDWLQFWSQFKQIHEDQRIIKEDKFQYLILAMEKDSKASEFVNSYPCIGENYDKVIAALKMRFGRDELLVEVYVRSLLQLALKNATKSNKKIPFSKTFDKLQSQINALESLDVTSDKFAIIMSTLVESSLPADILHAWRKHRPPVDSAENRLWKLMEFLQNEIEHEERITLEKNPMYGSLDRVVNKKKKPVTKKVKKSRNNSVESTGFASFLISSARRLFRVLIRKIG